MHRIGLSTYGFDLNEETFRALRESGIAAIEISKKYNEYDDIDYKAVGELSARYGVAPWSFHLPFSLLDDISALDKEIYKKTIERHKGLIEKGSDIGFSRFVLHPSAEPIKPEDREEKIALSMQALDILAEHASKCGAVIAVEDLPRTCLGNTAEEMLRLISANDKLRVCFDTNHLLQGSPTDFIERLGDKIVTLHVSDYDFLDEKHWLPGEGQVNWGELIDALKAVSYSGLWMYEVGLKCPNTLSRRDLCFDDYRENHAALFAGVTPPRID